MADELIDIFDENMNHIGAAMKSQAHCEGLWHKAFHCWIVGKNEKGQYKVWLQLRGKDKGLYPNLLDISVAGHLQAGETAKDGIREAEEEIGLKIDINKLSKLFTYKLAEDACGIINREFCPTYLLETDKKLVDLKMQPEEVDGVFEADVDDLADLVDGDMQEIEIFGMLRSDGNKYCKEVRKISLDALVPHGQEYYKKLFGMISRYVRALEAA